MKCTFGVSSRNFLGFMVHIKGINVDLAKAKISQAMKPLKTCKQLKSILGRMSYVCKFISPLAELLKLLRNLLKKNVPLQWLEWQQKPFQRGKDVLNSPLMMTSHVKGLPHTLYLIFTKILLVLY